MSCNVNPAVNPQAVLTYMKICCCSHWLWIHMLKLCVFSFSACQEEEDQKGNQNSWKPAWWNQHHPPGGHGQRPGGELEPQSLCCMCQPASSNNPVTLVTVCVWEREWACVCVRAVIMISTYLLISLVKPCVVLSLQSRTPALVFECINNTDFKVPKFGWHHTCRTTSTVTIHENALISIINNMHNSPVHVVYVWSLAYTQYKLLIHECVLTVWQELYQKLTDYDIRYYMYELLKVKTI